MRINKQILENLKPCENRWKNYLSHYESFDGDFDDFIDFEHVSYDDKIWVSKKVLSKNQLFHFAILCADSVLYIFETKYPNDSRVKDCLEFLKTIENIEIISPEIKEQIKKHRSAAYAATYSSSAAAYAAYVATDANYAYASASAADAATDASAYDSAAYAAYASAAYASAYAYASAAKKQQQDLHLTFLKMAASL